jgi:hypothetical protein
MKNIFQLLVLIVLIGLTSCSEYWDNHYNVIPETVDQDIWEVMQRDPEISVFVNALIQLKYDTVFNSQRTFTYFIPTNQALSQYAAGNTITKAFIDYHISKNFILSASITGKRRLQTLALKLALFERVGSNSTYDGIPLKFESPLYRNGKFYKMDQVAVPKPNLYEFFVKNNPLLSGYIDSKDSIIIDREKSRPIGFDPDGNTIYDTVSVTINNFEMKYFPVKQELRNFTATIVFPQKEKYEGALTRMAQSLGGVYQSHTDIPVQWQNDILIPYLLERGVFLNMLEETEFLLPPKKDTLKLLNILGDSVVINYKPINKSLASNGYAYDYETFNVPDTLFNGRQRFEGESLVREIGVNRFTWRDSVRVISAQSFSPLRQFIPGASKDSILNVTFNKGYTGRFSVEFKTPNLFPRRYRVVMRTHMDFGGIYEVYVNNKLVRTFNYFDYVTFRGVINSVQTPLRFIAQGRYNSFDFWMDNLTEYGRATIRFEYKAPANVMNNGFVMDYLEFIPQK